MNTRNDNGSATYIGQLNQPDWQKAYQRNCHHDYKPTFQGGDAYKCSKCGKEIEMTED